MRLLGAVGVTHCSTACLSSDNAPKWRRQGWLNCWCARRTWSRLVHYFAYTRRLTINNNVHHTSFRCTPFFLYSWCPFTSIMFRKSCSLETGDQQGRTLIIIMATGSRTYRTPHRITPKRRQTSGSTDRAMGTLFRATDSTMMEESFIMGKGVAKCPP